MNEFLWACLVKRPNKRSSAAALMMHPWVASTVKGLQLKGGRSATLATLVAESMPAIAEYREQASVRAHFTRH